MKKRLYIVAVNNRYGNNAFLPLVAGLMWGYAKQFPEITDGYELGGMLYLKEPIEQAIARLEKPDVVAFSSYIWNHEWNKAFATAIRKKWPGVTLVIGGVQVPNPKGHDDPIEEPFDFGIYGEGEGAFADFLKAHLINNNFAYEKVGSLIWYNINGLTYNERRAEVPIETIPSPYLDGLFDHIVSDGKWQYQSLQETNRGCPYACTFCAWGAASLSKLRQFPTERIVAEFEWMAKHKIGFLYNADANWGILPRDVELTEALIKTKEKFGYPQQMRAAFAKNSNDTVFNISKKLHDAGMLKATTLALQSMDEGVLVNIKRKNIKYEKLAELTKRYEDGGIATYSEIIVGLPGETLPSYLKGIDSLLEAGQHSGISIYLCMLLENTEMASEESREKYGIQSAKMKAMLYHGTPERGVVEEIQETVIATSTMRREDLKLAVLFGWVLQAFHSFGLTQKLARLAYENGTKYSSFYLDLLTWYMAHPNTVGGREIDRLSKLWDGAVAGEPWTLVDACFGEVSWPPEEFLFLNLACQSDAFYDELEKVSELMEFYGVAEQRAIFIPPMVGEEEEYAREAVWFGRKGSGVKRRLRTVDENNLVESAS